MNIELSEAPSGAAAQSSWNEHYVAYALITLVLSLIFAIRFHLRNVPLERDEGEYAYAGQLMLQGIPPYKLAYNMKLPGTYVAYALILGVFGQTASGIHIGVLLVNATTIFFVFLLALRLRGHLAAVAAGASYAVLSVSPSVLGFCGHATHFVVLMAMAGTLSLLKAIEKGTAWIYLASGMLLGLSFLMKQPGLLFVIFGALYLLGKMLQMNLSSRDFARKIGAFVVGAVLPFAVTCLWLWRAGVFRTFWFWTLSYASQYASNWSVGEGLHLLATTLPAIVGPALGIWLIAAAGIVAVLWKPSLRPDAPFVLGFLLFSFLAVCPALVFREHYFILMLPAVAILAGIGVSAGVQELTLFSRLKIFGHAPVLLLIVALVWPFYRERDFFFKLGPTAISRKIYGGNPFPEAIPIADYIRQHTATSDSIVVLGSDPEIYFYSHRHSATGYIYVYGLMEEQKYALEMQKQMVAEIEAAHPEMLVWINVRASWLPQNHSEGLLLSWAPQYVQQNYELCGTADIHMASTDYRWGEDAKSYQPRSNSVVFVFKRRSEHA